MPADEPDSLVLRYLRAIDEKVDRVAGDVREIKTEGGSWSLQRPSGCIGLAQNGAA